MEIKEIFLLGELFQRVQLEEVFQDGKTFVDSTPLISTDEINNSYNKEKNSTQFNLSAFVKKYFKEPETKEIVIKKQRPILEHLNLLWDDLLRQPEVSHNSLIALPSPYIIPGGRFREIYYWDSYFTMLGLEVSGRIDIIENMIDNFAYLVDHIGYIPNGNRTYYVGRSQPPFLAAMVMLLKKIKGNQIVVKYLAQLEKEYSFWIENRSVKMTDGALLNHYADQFDTPRPESFKEDYNLSTSAADPKQRCRNLRAGAESGWDFSSRWFKKETDFTTIHTTDIIPVDLNCLLYNLESSIALAYDLKSDPLNSSRFKKLAQDRAEAINKYCWNGKEGFYFDYDHKSNEQKTSLTLAGCFPLFFNIASHHQADAVKTILENKFLKQGGLVTTLVNTHQQWDSPNGWAPLQWIAIKGLMNYGHEELAREIAQRWMTLNEKVYSATGKMMEKYNVEDITLLAGGGEYPAQDGFGWTNGIYLKLHSLFSSTIQ